MTELEACVLALLCRDGPLTAYQVRQNFERSRASSWRASTGAVYPLIKRLHTQGLITMKSKPDDARGTKRLMATAAGRREVDAWLSDTPAWIGDITEDPIRTRVQFLTLLPAGRQRPAITRMLDATQAAIAAVDAETHENALERLAHEGVRAMLEARAAWLKKVLKYFAA